MNETFLETLKTFLSEGEDLIVATMVDTKGSAPQEKGAKVIVGKNGLLHGTVGGGKIETHVIKYSVNMLSNNAQTDFKEWNLQTDIGMTCGGVVSIYFERQKAKHRWDIVVFGAGHVAQELVRSLLRLECSLTCIDPRADWLEKLPEDRKLKKIHVENMASLVNSLPDSTYIVSMTMGHAFDLPILEAAFKRNCFPYIGAIGSLAKSKVLRRDLEARGVSSSQLENFFCPIGENFGNNTPVEIAYSVVAQLIKERDNNECT
jgi:xanthine dehydrogenase accessory factor